ncbi:MAG: class I SAM-dependent methyltransferase [Saprospiraceae bacterium]
MNREFTNFLRFILDSFLPPILRDNKFMMYPLFYIWFKGKNVVKLMEFKSRVADLLDDEYVEFYKIYDSLPKRATDLNKNSIHFILEQLGGNKNLKIIDIGCGNGFLLSKLKNLGYRQLYGCDIINDLTDKSIPFIMANIEHLPFKDDEYDIVLCNHTIEHIINKYKAAIELKRIAKYKVIVTTPKQRYYRYTFDLHVNFFPQKIDLISLMNMESFTCTEFNGDWSFAGNKNSEA